MSRVSSFRCPQSRALLRPPTLTTLAREGIPRRLMTAKGVDPVTAVRFIASLDVDRFDTPTPSSRISGSSRASSPHRAATPHRHHEGRPHGAALVFGAGGLGGAPNPSKSGSVTNRWVDEVEKRRGTRVPGVLALARKLAGILSALWRDGTVYEPRRSAAA